MPNIVPKIKHLLKQTASMSWSIEKVPLDEKLDALAKELATNFGHIIITDSIAADIQWERALYALKEHGYTVEKVPETKMPETKKEK